MCVYARVQWTAKRLNRYWRNFAGIILGCILWVLTNSFLNVTPSGGKRNKKFPLKIVLKNWGSVVIAYIFKLKVSGSNLNYVDFFPFSFSLPIAFFPSFLLLQPPSFLFLPYFLPSSPFPVFFFFFFFFFSPPNSDMAQMFYKKIIWKLIG